MQEKNKPRRIILTAFSDCELVKILYGVTQ